ncbi:MAG: hypothetical protein KDA52_04595 [Planctomycetaceae bacterium]|nr:hypothetical protein [Planctomycetaceae bacterium]
MSVVVIIRFVLDVKGFAMGMGHRESKWQGILWVATSVAPRWPRHVLDGQLNSMQVEAEFDETGG